MSKDDVIMKIMDSLAGKLRKDPVLKGDWVSETITHDEYKVISDWSKMRNATKSVELSKEFIGDGDFNERIRFTLNNVQYVIRYIRWGNCNLLGTKSAIEMVMKEALNK